MIARFRVIFRKPRRADIAIYDRVGSTILRQCVVGLSTWVVVDVRNVVYLHPSVAIRWAIMGLSQLLAPKSKTPKISLKILNESAVLQSIKPSIVLTYGENKQRFGVLSRILPGIHFVGIQNGLRGPTPNDINFRLTLTNFFCFGSDTIEKYRLSNQQIERFEIVGSLKSSLFEDKNPTSKTGEFGICLISQFRPARFDSSLPNLKLITEQQVQWAINYCRVKGLRFCIAGSCKENNFVAEYRYFSDLLKGEDFVFFPNDDNGLSSYRAMYRSLVSVTNHSTLGFEGLSLGLKVVFVNSTDDPYFNVSSRSEDDCWRVQGSSCTFEDFSSKVDMVIAMTDEQWRHQTSDYGSYFVAKPETIDARVEIRSEVQKYLGSGSEL